MQDVNLRHLIFFFFGLAYSKISKFTIGLPYTTVCLLLINFSEGNSVPLYIYTPFVMVPLNFLIRDSFMLQILIMANEQVMLKLNAQGLHSIPDLKDLSIC